MLNEMIDLGHGITGLALNLDETEVGVVILGDYTELEEGDEVRATGKLLQVPVGGPYAVPAEGPCFGGEAGPGVERGVVASGVDVVQDGRHLLVDDVPDELAAAVRAVLR